ncbi:IS1096 element passenger TnpR family protein [Colwellia sp. C1TZA3]|uniref:IS1096 element passenger TnpR family protein n=1 Tax=Colwellia sp. C1TZA3 TaxID=2508879 RepID=UPI0011BA1DE8|nr:plasmid pRiA4b ORF-3 family protein [Colwellia sp. C1TZA3]TWX68292.1 plasmid pRiA4b ORF-3 family protein [Colwellia sp. C1TZA3]
MIFTVKIKLVHGIYASDDWQCNIEIPSDFKLEDFHLVLQDLLAFDDDHMYKFYIANTERGQEIARFECDDELIEETSISEFLLKSKGKKAFYFFDYGDSWLFQISNSRKKPFQPVADVEYPRVISEVGVNPEQYPDWED